MVNNTLNHLQNILQYMYLCTYKFRYENLNQNLGFYFQFDKACYSIHVETIINELMSEKKRYKSESALLRMKCEILRNGISDIKNMVCFTQI